MLKCSADGLAAEPTPPLWALVHVREQRPVADTPHELAQLGQHRTTFAEQSQPPQDTLVDDRSVAEEVWFAFPGRRQQLEPMLRLHVPDRHLCQAGSCRRDVRLTLRHRANTDGSLQHHLRHHSNYGTIYGTIP